MVCFLTPPSRSASLLARMFVSKYEALDVQTALRLLSFVLEQEVTDPSTPRSSFSSRERWDL